MQAAILQEVNAPLTIEAVEIEKPKRREVLLRTAFAGLCHSDLHFIEGLYPFPLPCVLGHEAAAVVEAVGEDVTYVKPGDHVITCLSVFCGECAQCATGHPNLCENTEVKLLPGAARRLRWKGAVLNQAFNLSAFAEQMLVHEHAIVKIDPTIPLDRATLVGCGVMTGVGAVFNTAKVEPGSSVLVIGAGGVGLNVIQGCAIAGAGIIVAVDMAENKLELAKQFGATHTLNAGKEENLVKAVKKLTGGGADYAFECIGLGKMVEQAFRAVRKGGTALVVGVARGDDSTSLKTASITFEEKTLTGSYYGSARPREDFPRLIALYQAKKLKLDELITRTYGIDEAAQAFADLEAGRNARGVIVF